MAKVILGESGKILNINIRFWGWNDEQSWYTDIDITADAIRGAEQDVKWDDEKGAYIWEKQNTVDDFMTWAEEEKQKYNNGEETEFFGERPDEQIEMEIDIDEENDYQS